MLRRLIHNKAGQIPQLKSISKSLFGYNKAFFSNSQLDEGEYIDGDFSFGPTAAETRQRENEVEKKFVSFDNFGKNLVRQAPKGSNNYKNDITGSVQRIKSKFNFELAEEDEFARELAQRQQKKAHKKEKVQAAPGKRASEETTQKIKDAFKSHGREEIERLESNLVKIEITDRTSENQKNHPTQRKIGEIIERLNQSKQDSALALQEYNRGEEGIDFIVPAEDPAKAFENMQAEIINEIADYKLLSTKKKASIDRINEWRLSKEVKNRNLILEDEAPIYYPGSSKGRHPIDDVDFFVDWLKTNMPKAHYKFYQELIERTKEEREGVGAMKPTVTGVEHFIQSSVPISEIPLTNPEEKLTDVTDAPLVFRSHLDGQRGEIDLLPDVIDNDYQNIQGELEQWSLFRLYPMINNWFSMLEKQLKNMHAPPVMGDKVTPIPSLMRYYSLLPEFARSNPIVMDVVRAFEFTKHDLTIREKETAVNFACQFALPMEFDLEDSMKQAVISTKYFVPLWEEITLLDDSRDQASKEANLLGEKKKKAGPIKLIEDVLKQKEAGVPEDLRNLGDWQAPPRLDPYVPEEDPFPVLPIDFYDNEDGFWDDYIAQKEATYDEIPMIVTRPYFKH